MEIVKVALAVPLRRTFDYLPGEHSVEKLRPGMRVLVPFGKQQKTGIIVAGSGSSDLARKDLKTILRVIDDEPVLRTEDLRLLRWTSDYYHHPPGEVIFNALPARLRKGAPLGSRSVSAWSPSDAGRNIDQGELKRAPKQLALLNLLSESSRPLAAAEIEARIAKHRNALDSLLAKGLVEKSSIPAAACICSPGDRRIELNDEQNAATAEIISSLGRSEVFLLDGVTGSGKTEVYIGAMQSIVEAGKQIIILSPEIGLTPQLIERISSRISARLAILHSGLSDSERLQAWSDAREGRADIIIGTRSAIWTPLARPGLFIVDEEHDLSYKQQDGLRYSARDLAIMRGGFSGVPVVLGSATPSMESLHNVELGKFRRLSLDRRAGPASAPAVKVVDLRNKVLRGALSQPLIQGISDELSQNRQVMLFLNRRGYAPVLMCHECAWLARCDRCDVNLTCHKGDKRLACHHCGHTRPLPDQCPQCSGAQLVEVGHGTERLLETLNTLFPDARILRIDRDTTRRKGTMESMLAAIRAGHADILVGTQMLAKGHHFPGLALVGILDVDGGLCSADFRSSERMAQLFVQVSGRAGRETSTSTVILQTHFPEHPLLLSLIRDGYRAFARQLLEERRQSELPPHSYMALIRSEAHEKRLQQVFLEKVATCITGQVQVLGPFPAPIEKRAGKIRMQLLLLSDKRSTLARVLRSACSAIEKWPETRKLRWSIDIDPQDML